MQRRVGALATLLLLAASWACTGGEPLRPAATSAPSSRLTNRDVDALEGLAKVSVAASPTDGTAPLAVAELSPAADARLREQLAEAEQAARALATVDDAAAAGYVQSSAQAPGIGAHWINWALVDAPFDPGRPSMLLYDQRDGPPRLAGLSYWIRSRGAPPDGFEGPNDHWHRHAGLCFTDGWLSAEGVTAAECTGVWLAGGDLWMLHVWVAPGFRSTDGVFSARNPLLCPSDRAPVADLAKCPGLGGASPAQPVVDHGAEAPLPDDYYCHLPSS